MTVPVNEQGVEQWADKVPNKVGAIATLLLTMSGHYADEALTCVVEDTGCYHHPLLDACQVTNIPCRVYNPILTKQGIQGSVRGKKTDRTDALVIARMGLRGEGRLHTPEPYRATKYGVRAQQRLSELSCSIKLYQRHVEGVLEDTLSPLEQITPPNPLSCHTERYGNTNTEYSKPIRTLASCP